MHNSNSFIHYLLFFSREATSEIYGPRISSLLYLPSRSIFICFYFQIYYTKNTKIPCCVLFYLRSIYSIYDNLFPSAHHLWRRYSKGIDNPFNTPGCEYLLFVCRCCLLGMRRFTYWFDNLVSPLREIPTVSILHHPFLFGQIPM